MDRPADITLPGTERAGSTDAPAPDRSGAAVWPESAAGPAHGAEPGGKHEGVPDGMRVDEAGNLYVTGPKGIWIWDPEGHHLGTIEMPEQPANLIWGDNDYRTLYITATTSVYKLRTIVRGLVPYLAQPQQRETQKVSN